MLPAAAAIFLSLSGPGSVSWRPPELQVAKRAAPDADAITTLALRYLGRPYVMGGVGDPGFDCSGFVCRVYAEGGYGLPRVSRDQAEAGIDVPLALVAHSGSQVLGTAALRADDLPGREDLTPWLGGMYVAPQFRGRGIGAALCAAAERKAAALFETPMLYLFTLDRQAWYGRLGWSLFEPCSWCGRRGDIMVKKMSSA